MTRLSYLLTRVLAALGALFLSGCAHEAIHSNGSARPPAIACNTCHAKLLACQERLLSALTPPAAAKPKRLSMAWINNTIYKFATESKAADAIEQQYLENLGMQRTEADNFKLGYLLLAHANPRPSQAAIANELLGGLDRQTNDLASRQFIRLMQDLSEETMEVLQLRNELSRSVQQVADLQSKLRQINKLEVELQQRARSEASPPK